jgi:hypothetical protein
MEKRDVRKMSPAEEKQFEIDVRTHIDPAGLSVSRIAGDGHDGF